VADRIGYQQGALVVVKEKKNTRSDLKKSARKTDDREFSDGRFFNGLPSRTGPPGVRSSKTDGTDLVCDTVERRDSTQNISDIAESILFFFCGWSELGRVSSDSPNPRQESAEDILSSLR